MRVLSWMIVFWGVALGCHAQNSSVLVTALRTNTPVVAGRYAAVACTVRNTGRVRVPIRAISLWLIGADGREEAFNVAPPWEKPTETLAPGHTFTLHRFKRVDAAGDYACVARYQSGSRPAVPLQDVQGKPASAPLRLWPANSVPQADFVLTDPHADHVYAPGETIRLQMMPVVTAGADLSGEVTALTVTPGAKPFSMTDPTEARARLLPAPKMPKQDGGFSADFYGVNPAKHYLDLAIEFRHPVQVSALRLSGVNLNDQYGVSGCEAEAWRRNGGMVSLPVVRLSEGNTWTVVSSPRANLTASGLHLRVYTPYKINITALTVQGATSAGRKVAGSVALSCRWTDAHGTPLTKSQPLTASVSNTIAAPPRTASGYYGLVVIARVPNWGDIHREFGFAVLPPAAGADSTATDPRLGIVHMDMNDPHLGEGWIKTLGTPFYNSETQALDVAGWQQAMKNRRTKGLTELPLVSGAEWETDPTKPVSPEQLQRLTTKMRQHFEADPSTRAWELGIEENLGWRAHRDTWIYYWANLEAKVQAVRQAAESVNPSINLVYQVAELDPRSVEDFCKSGAAKQFDILSLHPYAWPDFPAPERWMPAYLAQVRALQKRYNVERPIWFTEIGAPHNGNPGGFFGYPSNGAYVRGLSRSEYAAYLVKCHVIALRLGVEKVFWYNYRDRGRDPEFAEDHFGLVDYWGYPKPAYVAYATLSRMLRGRTMKTASVVDSNVQVCRFTGARQDCLVVWTDPAVKRSLSLARLGLSSTAICATVDLWGRSVPIRDGVVPVSGQPLYLTLNSL